MKRLMAFILAALAFASCVKELDAGEECAGVPEGSKVTITFTIPGDPDCPPQTRAVPLEERAELNDLHIAVFGSSGYLKEYVHASQPVVVGTHTYQRIENNVPYDHTVPLYQFTATFTITEGWRTLHFIGNGPSTLSFGYEESVMTSLLSENGACAYWQMKKIHGLKAKKSTSSYTDLNGRHVNEGDFIDADGNLVTGNTGYVPDDNTKAAFQNIALVRNWAKITVVTDNDPDPITGEPNNPYFTPISYAVVNVPSRGAIAPHCAATGFVQDYQNNFFEDLVALGYTANLPARTAMDATIPSDYDFKHPDYPNNGVTAVTVDSPGAVYMYERPLPTESTLPTAVIVYGQYDNPNDQEHKGPWYYKVDLMEDDKYYPIFRNFRYQIKITKILSMGHHTPAAAAAAAGSADVSADINASHLADISDGTARLILSPSLSHAYSEGQTDNQLLQAFFVDRVEDWHVNMVASAVTVHTLDMPNGEDDVITSCSIDPPIDNIAGSIGWRTIHFTTVDQEASVRSQTIRVTANYTDVAGTHRLYRDVVITLMPTQNMKLRFQRRYIPAVKGSPLVMDIIIPDGLPESMFPLDFWIEPEDMTLTPDVSMLNNNLPVASGPSINREFGDGTAKPTFHYTRNLSWDEYKALQTELDDDSNTNRVLTCYFKSNADASATTVWVKCNHFSTTSARFTNSDELTFLNLAFTNPIKREDGTVVRARFNVPELEGYVYPRDYPVITLSSSGMELVSVDGNTPSGSAGTYTIIPTSSAVVLEFVTLTDDGDVQFELSATDYQTATLKSHTFKNFGFVDGHTLWKKSNMSSVVCGRINSYKNQYFLFGYEDDPAAPNAEISLVNCSPGLQFSYPTEYPWVPDGPRASNGVQTYHEIDLRTQGSPNNSFEQVYFTLSAPGYIEEEVRASRFYGSVYRRADLNYNTVFLPENTYGFDADTKSFTVIMEAGKATEHSVTFSFDKISELRSSDPKGLLLAPDDTYILTVTNNSAAAGFYPYYIQFNVNSGKWGTDGFNGLMAPDMTVSGASAGTFTKYRGANNQFIWNLPAGTTTATLTLKAPAGGPISIREMILCTYKGELYSN